MRAKQRAGRTITVRVRFVPLRSITRSVTLSAAVSATLIITDLAEELVCTALADHPNEREVSLLAISVSNLVEETALQMELPLHPAPGGDVVRPGSPAGSARWAVDRSMDAVRARFGRGSVGYTSVALSGLDLVPDEFRELAEREV